MVYLGGRVVDCIEVFQEKTLAVIDPLAGDPSLKIYEHKFQ